MNNILILTALEILRSGHCSGNYITNLDDSSIRDLKVDVTTLLDIAKMSPKRSKYHSMEMVDISSQKLEAFTASESLTFMALLRLKDIEKATGLIDKKHLLKEGWEEMEEVFLGKKGK